MTSAQGEQHHDITASELWCGVAAWAFPSATAVSPRGWEMASSKSAIAKLLENVDGSACKQAARFLRPVDLQIVILFLQDKQNFI